MPNKHIIISARDDLALSLSSRMNGTELAERALSKLNACITNWDDDTPTLPSVTSETGENTLEMDASDLATGLVDEDGIPIDV